MKKITAKISIKGEGGGAEFEIPYDGSGGIVEKMAKYMLITCGWNEALIEDDVDDVEGMVKPRRSINGQANGA